MSEILPIVPISQIAFRSLNSEVAQFIMVGLQHRLYNSSGHDQLSLDMMRLRVNIQQSFQCFQPISLGPQL